MSQNTSPSLRVRRHGLRVFLVLEPSGKEFGPYNHVYSWEVDETGTPYFAMRRGDMRYAVHGDKTYGPYNTVFAPKIIGGKICFVCWDKAPSYASDNAIHFYVVHGDAIYGPFETVEPGSLIDIDGLPDFTYYEGETPRRFRDAGTYPLAPTLS